MNKIVGLTAPHKYLQLFTYTREYIDRVGFEKFLQKSKDQFRAEGHEGFTHYFTFRFDDYKRNMVCLVFLNNTVEETLSFTVTAPTEDLETAVEWVKQNTPHLVFNDEREIATSDYDVLGARATVELYSHLKPTA